MILRVALAWLLIVASCAGRAVVSHGSTEAAGWWMFGFLAGLTCGAVICLGATGTRR